MSHQDQFVPRRARGARLLGAMIFLSCAAGAAGCMATVEPVGPGDEEDITWVETVPADYARYPHEVYAGRDVYYIHGAWHFRAGGRWGVYRREPAELARRRVRR